MKDIFYIELRKNCIESLNFTKEQLEKVANAVKNILTFHKLAAKEGFLYLEEACKTLDQGTEDKYLAELVELVMDGADSKQISDYGLNRYFAANMTGCEGLIYLIYLKGVLMIEENEKYFIAEKILVSMLPENARKLYIEKEIQEAERTKKLQQEELKRKIDLLCGINNNPKPGEKYTLLSEASLFFEEIADKDMQRILKEIDCWALSAVMKGLSGNALRRIFDNLTDKVAAMIVEDMEDNIAVRLTEINEAAIKIINVVIKLAEAGEISNDNLLELKTIMGIYNSNKSVCDIYKERYSKLKQALDDICESPY